MSAASILNTDLRRSRQRQAGFSLIELMITLTISLFMLLGFAVVFVNMRVAFVSQDQLAQLQDNQRLAFTILANTVQAAGYFPDPLISTATANLPAASGGYGALVAGQGVVGTDGGTGENDTLTTRYVSASGDGLVDCLGQTNTSGAKAIVSSTFSISDAQELMCSVDGGVTSTALISNVSGLVVLYGTDTDADGGTDRYLTATEVTAAAAWPSVKTTRMTLSFVNPFAGEPGQPATVSWMQTINLMNKI